MSDIILEPELTKIVVPTEESLIKTVVAESTISEAAKSVAPIIASLIDIVSEEHTAESTLDPAIMPSTTLNAESVHAFCDTLQFVDSALLMMEKALPMLKLIDRPPYNLIVNGFYDNRLAEYKETMRGIEEQYKFLIAAIIRAFGVTPIIDLQSFISSCDKDLYDKIAILVRVATMEELLKVVPTIDIILTTKLIEYIFCN